MPPFRYSYFQLTFGQEEAYLHPEKSYQRLQKFGYDAIELTPPKGRYGLGVKMDDYLKMHQRLAREYGLAVSCINECWGAMWDPYSPTLKTLTETKTADLAVSETKTSIDFAVELGAPFVTVATAIHADIAAENVAECTAVALDALRRMCDYAAEKGVRLVFEATNHLEMGKYVNTAMNHRRMIQATERANIGIQLDWFHANLEELNPYEAVMEAGDLLWHIHFRDSNSLTPGYGTVDFKAVMRALKKINYAGFCTIESAPMIPDPDTAAQDGITYLKMLTAGKGADVIVTATPAPVAQVQAVEMARKGGRILLFGGLPKDQSKPGVDMNIVHYNALHLIGTTIFAPRHQRAALNLLASGRIPGDKLVTHRFPLSEIVEGANMALEGKVLKAVFYPNDPEEGSHV